MAALTGATVGPVRGRVAVSPDRGEGRKVVRDSLIVTLGGQVERAVGVFTSLALRWWLDPARLGVYTGLRLFLDNTNRSSLGVGLGAVQEIPVLRAAGREAEAKRLADVAFTVNTLTCFAYAVGLIAWALVWANARSAAPLADEWSWGLVAVAGLAIIKRHESFLVAILRAHREFTLTAELDVAESVASACLVGVGLWFWGFWGLLGAVGVVSLVKIAYARARHPFRFRWDWDVHASARLMVIGLPILANTAVYGALMSVDRVVILSRLPDGARAAGLYSVALAGTGWALDLSGRVVMVVYTSFQTTLGLTNDPSEVARQAVRAVEAMAPPLLAGSALAYLAGPTLLGLLMPRYVDGLPALRPLFPGMLLMSLAWPARQMLIAVGRPYRLGLATLAGLGATAPLAVLGGDRAGIVGVAAGTSVGLGLAFMFTSAAAIVPLLGPVVWAEHLGRLGATVSVVSAATLVAVHTPPILNGHAFDFGLRVALLGAGLLVWLAAWGRRQGWGGLSRRGRD